MHEKGQKNGPKSAFLGCPAGSSSASCSEFTGTTMMTIHQEARLLMIFVHPLVRTLLRATMVRVGPLLYMIAQAASGESVLDDLADVT